jgi:adenine-specific DNA-methyltransferase
LIERILDLTVADDPDALILDSFAGSGTTAHAVLNLNAKDGGNRRFILVECEDYADTLTAERVRRVINGYPFKGTQRETLYEKKLTWTALQKVESIMAEAKQTAQMHEGNFDSIETKVDEGTLKMVGIRKVEEHAPGLGGGFTYCTLGDPLDIDKILTGDQLPSFENIAGWLVHTAFGTTLPSVADNRGEGLDEWYVGETDTHHVWVMYRPDRAWLQSRDASLTLALAEQMAKKHDDKPHQVFAPAKFVGKAALDALKPRVEFAPLPFALYRLERS